MKKKRFMRLVMSYGVQRNEAARMAARVVAFGTYEALFAACRPLLVGRAAIQGLRGRRHGITGKRGFETWARRKRA